MKLYDLSNKSHRPANYSSSHEYHLGDIIVQTEFKVTSWAKVSSANKAEQDYERLSTLPSTSIDLQLLLALVTKINKSTPKDEGILVFLPGFASIDRLSTMIEDSNFRDSFRIIVLHSQMDTSAQNRNEEDAFTATDGTYRKIILATNIAETSITIDGIVHVIDSGLSKMRTYNGDTDSSQLIVSRISQASAKQRKGRAGRTRPGNCYRLYSKQA